MRAAVYLRRSTERQEKSITAQRSELTAFASSKGYSIVAEYCDDGISGNDTAKRLGFQRMMREGAAGAFDIIICWDQDRFGRFDPIEGGYWIHPLRAAGVVLETMTQGRVSWDDMPGRVMWSITQESKHAYLIDLAMNVARGCRKSYESGTYPSSAPYGYRKDGKRLKLGPDVEINAVREIFRLKADGYGARVICHKLAAAGFPPPKAAWSESTVRQMLNRVAYLGHTQVSARKAPGRYKRVFDAPTTFEATHPAIITQGDWDAAHRPPIRPKPKVRHGVPVAPFSGYLICGLCGSRMYSMARGGDFIYICGRYRRGLGCVWCPVSERRLVREIAERIRGAVQIPRDKLVRHLTNLIASQQATTDVGPQIARLNRSIERMTDRMLLVEDALVPKFRKKLSALILERDALAASTSEPTARIDPEELANELARLPRLVERASRGEIRDIVSRWLATPITAVIEEERTTPQKVFSRVKSLTITLSAEVP